MAKIEFKVESQLPVAVWRKIRAVDRGKHGKLPTIEGLLIKVGRLTASQVSDILIQNGLAFKAWLKRTYDFQPLNFPKGIGNIRPQPKPDITHPLSQDAGLPSETVVFDASQSQNSALYQRNLAKLPTGLAFGLESGLSLILDVTHEMVPLARPLNPWDLVFFEERLIRHYNQWRPNLSRVNTLYGGGVNQASWQVISGYERGLDQNKLYQAEGVLYDATIESLSRGDRFNGIVKFFANQPQQAVGHRL